MNEKGMGQNKIIKAFTCRWRFFLFALYKLPMAVIARLRVEELNFAKSSVRVPYNYWNKNPFKSMYFAVQAMAAELSTGALVMLHGDGQNISMLVTHLESRYYKKATTNIKFICLDGEKIFASIQDSIKTNQAQICKLKSKGYDVNGICVSEFDVTWSLKRRNA